MTPDEIRRRDQLFEQARKKERGIWRHFDRIVGQLHRLKVDHDGKACDKKAQQADRGPLVVPKIYRRQLRYDVLQQNDLAPKTFSDYLAGKPLKGQTTKGTKDAWAARSAFLANPTMNKPTKAPNDSLAGLMSAGNAF